MDLNIDLNLPEPINKSLNPIATAAGETFANIWNACFAPVNLWAQKRIIKHEQDFFNKKRTFFQSASVSALFWKIKSS